MGIETKAPRPAGRFCFGRLYGAKRMVMLPFEERALSEKAAPGLAAAV